MIGRIVLLCCVLVYSDAVSEGDKCAIGGVEGVCTLISNCKSAIEALKKKTQPQKCGFMGVLPVVCCVDNTVNNRVSSSPTVYTPAKPIVSNDKAGLCDDISPSLTLKKTGQKALDKCIDYQEKYVYPCEKTVSFIEDYSRTTKCHNNADELISGGNDTKIHEFPHMVLLGYGQNEDSIQWLCGGSIISEKYILSAGHCIASRSGDVKYVLVGAHTRSDSNDRSKIYKIKRIISHPDYEPPVNYNDIMLLETEKTITLSEYVIPACLHIGDPINDESVLATGWGNLGKWGSLSEVMQKVILNKFSTEECTRKYSDNQKQLTRGYDPQSQLCYGHRTEAKDTCKGDSGGPLQIKSKKIHCMYVIVGVTSFGRKCGQPAEPAIYTRVAHYLQWIENIVWP